jgi:hypothetical protein
VVSFQGDNGWPGFRSFTPGMTPGSRGIVHTLRVPLESAAILGEDRHPEPATKFLADSLMIREDCLSR